MASKQTRKQSPWHTELGRYQGKQNQAMSHVTTVTVKGIQRQNVGHQGVEQRAKDHARRERKRRVIIQKIKRRRNRKRKPTKPWRTTRRMTMNMKPLWLSPHLARTHVFDGYLMAAQQCTYAPTATCLLHSQISKAASEEYRKTHQPSNQLVLVTFTSQAWWMANQNVQLLS